MTYIKKPSIIWQKWVDPFYGTENDSTHETLDEMLEEPSYIDDTNESEDSDIVNESKQTIYSKERIKAIITPMGIIPMDEYSASSRIFNFWIGHTNFSISQDILDIIDTSDGVETLDIFTRYRFRIGIGKLFKPSEVMSDINHEVIKFLNKYG